MDLCLKFSVKHILLVVFYYSLGKLALLNILVYFKIYWLFTASSVLVVVIWHRSSKISGDF